MFAYLGLESATVPAGDVRDPERTIPRSTVLGIAIAATLYVLGTVVVMGVLPREQLVHSLAPFSDAARVMWGRAGRDRDLDRGDPVVDRRAQRLDLADGPGADGGGARRTVPAIVRYAVEREMFRRSGSLSRRSLPPLLVLVQAAGSEGFSAFYNLVVGLSTMAAVVPYAFCALAGSLIAPASAVAHVSRV